MLNAFSPFEGWLGISGLINQATFLCQPNLVTFYEMEVSSG
jgi:hypothetical protein